MFFVYDKKYASYLEDMLLCRLVYSLIYSHEGYMKVI